MIASVAPGPAADAGLQSGDVVIEVDGHPVRDVIDWWWLTAEDAFRVTVLRQGSERVVDVISDPAAGLGVSFTEVLFTPVRQCENACAFCFISGLPVGLRPALYVRDDDFRLSFLSGNFITLTNLTDEDIARIVTQRLSPLHVSVHAVDPDVRARLICPTHEDRALGILDELLGAGVEVHVQIVLVPGVNDGRVLDDTLGYLSAREGVLSVGCVPMGFTAHQARWAMSYDGASAATVLGMIQDWQDRVRPERGVGWVYGADELYIVSGVPMPPAAAYDDFCQFENGIGMVAAFAEELSSAPTYSRGASGGVTPESDESAPQPGPPCVAPTIVTGELFAPVLRSLLDDRGWRHTRILPVRNDLFGGNVGVTGLLGGRDITRAIAADGGLGTYLVPDVVVNSDGLLIDDVSAGALAASGGADIRIVGSDAISLSDALARG